MNDTTSAPDQADEDILLAYDVADEALEAAAGTGGGFLLRRYWHPLAGLLPWLLMTKISSPPFAAD